MKNSFFRLLLLFVVCFALFSCSSRSEFERNFTEETLRIDLNVINMGPEKGIEIDSLFIYEGWAGRRVNLDSLPNPFYFTYTLIDAKSGKTILRDSKHIDLHRGTREHPCKTYLLIPRPRRDVRLLAVVYRFDDAVEISSEIYLAAKEIETKAQHLEPIANVVPIIESDWPTPITLTIVPDGYTAEEMPKFLEDAHRFTDSLFSNKAFAEYRNRFVVSAVKLASEDSGISRPSKGEIRRTAFGAHYDSYSMDRLVTLPDVMRIPRALHGIPSGHVIILANSTIYGGSGAYNEYCIGFTGEYWAPFVQIHEFGHSFGNLGDEYEEGFEGTYTPDREPAEPNITTLHDFSGKWQNLIDSGEATLIEGAGYQSKGVWRGSEHCLMRSVADKKFCPVCTQALTRQILFYTE